MLRMMVLGPWAGVIVFVAGAFITRAEKGPDEGMFLVFVVIAGSVTGLIVGASAGVGFMLGHTMFPRARWAPALGAAVVTAIWAALFVIPNPTVFTVMSGSACVLAAAGAGALPQPAGAAV